MADLNKRALSRKLTHTGTYGNGFKEYFNFKGDAASGDRVFLGVVPQGSVVTDMRLVQGGNGASGATLDVGVMWEDGTTQPDYFASGVDATVAGSTRTEARPLAVEGQSAYLFADVNNAGITGGDIDAVVERTFQGAF